LGFGSEANWILQAKKANAGSDWYNLPKTVITPEFKRDLQLFKMRDVLDPKRFCNLPKTIRGTS
jgi:hypothetical protein